MTNNLIRKSAPVIVDIPEKSTRALPRNSVSVMTHEISRAVVLIRMKDDDIGIIGNRAVRNSLEIAASELGLHALCRHSIVVQSRRTRSHDLIAPETEDEMRAGTRMRMPRWKLWVTGDL